MSAHPETSLSHLPDTSKNIIRYLRRFIETRMPMVHEYSSNGALNFSLTESSFDRVCQIVPLKRGVILKFFFGSSLFDPLYILAGRGTRLRYVHIKTVREAKSYGIAQLIKDAWKDAPHHITRLHEQRRKRNKQVKPTSAKRKTKIYSHML